MSYIKHWKSSEELNPKSTIAKSMRENEFVEKLPVDRFFEDKTKLENSDTSRRDFLKYVGFSTVAAGLVACEGPVVKSIPYVVQPEQIIPGIANYYATTIFDGFDFASVLVKTREGRPIKIENNLEAPKRGVANARVQASVLSLYDNGRLKKPILNGSESTLDDLNEKVRSEMKKALASDKSIVLVSPSMSSHATKNLMLEFAKKYPNFKHVVYDNVNYDYIATAHFDVFGVRALPQYDFSEVDLVVSFGADFLGDWLGGGLEKSYVKNRAPKKGKILKHYQLESNLTLTGSNADVRMPFTPTQQKVAFSKFVSFLYGFEDKNASDILPEGSEEKLKKLSEAFKNAGKNAVLLTDIEDVDVQKIALEVNLLNESKGFLKDSPITLAQSSDYTMDDLIAEMKAEKVGVLLSHDVNPVYTLFVADQYVEGLNKVDFSVALTFREDESSILHKASLPLSHCLESWNDHEASINQFFFTQPTIRPLFESKQLQDHLLNWMGRDESYYDYLKSYWVNRMGDYTMWEKAIHDGFYVKPNNGKLDSKTTINKNSIDVLLSGLSVPPSTSDFELTLYTKAGMGDGRQANNPWLQEFPDPITRVSWDNYLTISYEDAKTLNLENFHVANGGLNGSYVSVSIDNIALTLPVIIQPAQAKGSVGIALGYGKKEGLKPEMQVGINAFKLYKDYKKVQQVKLEKRQGEHEFACIQLHNTLMGRGDIIKETTLENFVNKDRDDWNPIPKVSLNHKETPVSEVSIWQNFERTTGHHFNLSIDLNSCIGCGACVIACTSENNVPVVGKKEVRRSRDMHWLRIDRYYSSSETFESDVSNKENISGLSESMSGFGDLETPMNNPQVVFQPVMCQHCNHAPCETVCPVAATSHGRQGQNQMAYNRCVGTRYCANNCPYKVRRFNWFQYSDNDEFDYHTNNDLGKMVLNPDVNVRSRGVMEKCSMCIQRTQKTILDAKKDGREIKDSEFQTACSSACGTGAIVFGDINDTSSQVHQLGQQDTAYHLLESVGTQPNVFYHVKVRNNS